ncbi:hypothetical protein LIPSTDRAFT_124359 [Lipomyces starkeyi NRRL Y-11557]|uniref:Uncharacterized protein n=1 Tax=Lipomyces starkeyi NRRL Y-11557 TaxID=675824 RepID=A0A1E3QF13_LIPST|nr:hypothetical protein LIPSTDRAFT_124359 [Lipomyces starkeyi NRRL Y-11557]
MNTIPVLAVCDISPQRRVLNHIIAYHADSTQNQVKRFAVDFKTCVACPHFGLYIYDNIVVTLLVLGAHCSRWSVIGVNVNDLSLPFLAAARPPRDQLHIFYQNRALFTAILDQKQRTLPPLAAINHDVTGPVSDRAFSNDDTGQLTAGRSRRGIALEYGLSVTGATVADDAEYTDAFFALLFSEAPMDYWLNGLEYGM